MLTLPFTKAQIGCWVSAVMIWNLACGSVFLKNRINFTLRINQIGLNKSIMRDHDLVVKVAHGTQNFAFLGTKSPKVTQGLVLTFSQFLLLWPNNSPQTHHLTLRLSIKLKKIFFKWLRNSDSNLQNFNKNFRPETSKFLHKILRKLERTHAHTRELHEN